MSVSTQSSVIYYPGYSQQQVFENLIVRPIESISNSYPMIVTTTIDHKYVAGMMVRFLIPSQFGMVELNELLGQVLSLTNDQLAIDIDSTNFSVFSYPVSLPSAYTQPSVIPNNSGPYLPPKPLPFGNQNSFEGVFFNNGALENPINGV
jgi:hypothetical protein